MHSGTYTEQTINYPTTLDAVNHNDRNPSFAIKQYKDNERIDPCPKSKTLGGTKKNNYMGRHQVSNNTFENEAGSKEETRRTQSCSPCELKEEVEVLAEAKTKGT